MMKVREGTGEFRAVWLVRAGGHGEDEETALDMGLAIVGFHDIPSLEGLKTDAEIFAHLEKATPGEKLAVIRNRAGQLAAFALRMQEGDIVALPLKTAAQVALGRVAGPYSFKGIGGAGRHVRPVEWLRPDLPRTAIEQDLLYSLGAFLTVCRIQRNDAERRFTSLIKSGEDPGFDGAITAGRPHEAEAIAESQGLVDTAQAAHDQIVARIQSRFREHELARLVDAILQAEGYQTLVSPPGADGGVDILAGRGSLGLEGPRLCVQVKSSKSPSDVKIFRELKGTMDSFSADVGLLVSWGGFTKPLLQEARQGFFQVRLWDSADLVRAVYRTYDQLPEEIQAELPLKKVWGLVVDELEG